MEKDLRGKQTDIPTVRRVERPWGWYKLFAENTPCTAKVLHIRRNEMLSLQYHRHRDQLYYLLDDFVISKSTRSVPVEIDGDLDFLRVFVEKYVETKKYRQGDIIHIPKFYIHRPMFVDMHDYGCIVDMAFGHNDENDIFRIEDKYGRIGE